MGKAGEAAKGYAKQKAVKWLILAIKGGSLGPLALAAVFISIFIAAFMGTAFIGANVQSSIINHKIYSLEIPASVLNLCFHEHMEDRDIDFCELLAYICADKYFELEYADSEYIKEMAYSLKNDKKQLDERFDKDTVNEFKDIISKAFDGYIGSFIVKKKETHSERRKRTVSGTVEYYVTWQKDGSKSSGYKSSEEITVIRNEGYSVSYHYETETEIVDEAHYGIKPFFPIAKSYEWSHYDDFDEPRDYGGERYHNGNDIMASGGVPVIAVEGGKITDIGYGETGGYHINIESNQRLYVYSHLDSFHPDSKKGKTIKAGSVIGYVGDTGYGPEVTRGKFDPHLHIQIGYKYEGETYWINPYNIMEFLKNHNISVERKNGEYYTLEQLY